MILATPDFGASGLIVLFVLVQWMIILALVIAGVVWGARLLRNRSSRLRKAGLALVLFCGSVPFFCYLGPQFVIRIIYGNYPIGSYPNNRIKKGMTMQEVTGILGVPHERSSNTETETWIYWIDSFSMHWFGVSFGADGTVTNTFGN